MGTPYGRSVVWFRRDLRLQDHCALYEAATRSDAVAAAFVVDTALLASPRMGAPLVQACFGALGALRERLRERGSDLAVLHGAPHECLPRFVAALHADAVYFNEDVEPAALERDARVRVALEGRSIDVHSWIDQVYFGAGEICRPDGGAYRVFTPYKRRWLDFRALAPRTPFPSEAAAQSRWLPATSIGETGRVPAPEDYGFSSSHLRPPVSETRARVLLDRFVRPDGPIVRYRDRRDRPAAGGTSRLSPQLRAGTVGIRTCVERAFALRAEVADADRSGTDAWIGELIWRDFYQMVLARWPHVAEAPFLAAAQRIPWRDDEPAFAAWCDGRTGYPIVDAAMRQLNIFGWMHNRLRMIVASFLTKHLLIDWRRGERYFELRLADADLAQNNGGWQWSSSTGTDAAPYFRIFNPVLQSRTIDPAGAFIRRMLPALRRVPGAYVHAPWEMPPLIAREANVEIGMDYPAPIVDHARARERALVAFGALRAKEG